MAKRIKRKSNSGSSAGLRIERVPVGDIRPHPRNPRVHDEANLRAIAASLEEFGQRTPIVVWSKKNYIIKGCGTWQAISEILEWVEVDVVRAEGLTEKQALAYAVADNKTTDMSSFDFDAVASILGEAVDAGVRLEATGFTEEEVQPLLQTEAPEAFAEYDEDLEVEHVCPKCGYEWS